MRTRVLVFFLAAVLAGLSAEAATITGVVSDPDRCRAVRREGRPSRRRDRPGSRRPDRCRWAVFARGASHRYVPRHRVLPRVLGRRPHRRRGPCRPEGRRPARAGARGPQLAGERHGGARRPRDSRDSAACRDLDRRRHRAGQPAVDRRRARRRRQHHAGRQRSVRCPAAAARPRLDAAAGARRRRAAEHRAAGHGSRPAPKSD